MILSRPWRTSSVGFVPGGGAPGRPLPHALCQVNAGLVVARAQWLCEELELSIIALLLIHIELLAILLSRIVDLPFEG